MPKATRTSWYRDHFTRHPHCGLPVRASGACQTSTSGNVYGKSKVWCRLCFERRVREAEVHDVPPVIQGAIDVVDTREAIIEELWSLPRQSAGWIVCRLSNCLVHLRDCALQPQKVRETARVELEHINLARRAKARQRSRRPVAAAATIQPMSPSSIDVDVRPSMCGQSADVPGDLMAWMQNAPEPFGLPRSPYYPSADGLLQSNTHSCGFAEALPGLALATASSFLPRASVNSDFWSNGSASALLDPALLELEAGRDQIGLRTNTSVTSEVEDLLKFSLPAPFSELFDNLELQ